MRIYMRYLILSLLLINFSTSIFTMQRVPVAIYGLAIKKTSTSSQIIRPFIQKRNFSPLLAFLLGTMWADESDSFKEEYKKQKPEFSSELCNLLHLYKIAPNNFDEVAQEKMEKHGTFLLKRLKERLKKNKAKQGVSFFKSTKDRLLIEESQIKDEISKQIKMLEDFNIKIEDN